MRGRRNRNSIVANPVLVGAVTTLVVIVAVFLAYNANNGLPFVPTRNLKVVVPNGAMLVKGNEVRSGGYRVGVVDAMRPVRLRNGSVGAMLDLQLDKQVGAVPLDSTVKIRPRSALGLKYVELDLGRSRKTFGDGATLPVNQTSIPVEIDQFYSTFDAKTRAASQVNLQGFGDAFSGRGADISRTIQIAPALFGHLSSVMANLNDPATDLPDFFRSLDTTARVVAPVSKINAHLFTTMANTFDAFSRDPQALKDTISKSPPTLAVGTESFRVQRPFLAHTAAFSADLNTASRALRGALPDLNAALGTGVRVTQREPVLNNDLQGALSALDNLVRTPTTPGALRGVGATVGTLQPQLRYLGPYVTVCNYWNDFWTFAAEHLSAPDATGTAQRALLNSAGGAQKPGGDSVDASGANEFAHTDTSIGNSGVPEALHNNFYGDAIFPDGSANCAIGQQGYVNSSNPFRDRSVKGDPYAHASVEHPHQDVPIGPSYSCFNLQGRGIALGPNRPPAGETYTWRPGGIGADTAIP
jgi:virulence factor Mce-like protein